MNRTVYILGAGCSVKYGYPLARHFVDALEAFGSSLGDDAQQVRRCVRDTVALMRQRAILTLDDLTSRIDNAVFDEAAHVTPQIYAKRHQRIRDAKIATSALFLSIEAHAGRTGLAGYHEFILKLFPGTGNWHHRLEQARCHVLTFNYDRLFEMAFLSRFGVDTGQYLLYGGLVLNSGFNDLLGGSVSFNASRFSFLKLHGSVGMRVREEYGQPNYYPYIDGIRPGEVNEIKDRRFFPDSADPNPEPLIVFPFEKHYLQSGRKTRLAFRDFIPKVWERAKEVVAQAEEIRVVGYSFATMDRLPIVELLAGEIPCKKIVIQNLPGEAEQICAMLRLEHPQITTPLEAYPCGF